VSVEKIIDIISSMVLLHDMGPEVQLPPASPTDERLGTPEYLAQLMKDKRTLQAFPNAFIHLERVLDDEIARVRSNVLYLGTNTEPLCLPEPLGPVISLTEKLVVPTKDYPDFNFVGRLLGPRGMTAKQLEMDTGCRILVRGQGSLRDKKKEEQMKGKAKWEHLNEDLHVLINVEDSKNRAQLKMKRAVEEIKKLLVPSLEGEDELKKRQLMELALLNGTYKGCTNIIVTGTQLGSPGGMLAVPMLMRSADHAGAPIFLPPPLPFFTTGPLTPLPSPAALANGSMPPPPLLSPCSEAPTGFFYQMEPCIISPTSPMIEYPFHPLQGGDFSRHPPPTFHHPTTISYAR